VRDFWNPAPRGHRYKASVQASSETRRCHRYKTSVLVLGVDVPRVTDTKPL